MQLTIDGRVKEPGALLDRQLMFDLLIRLPEALTLHIIHGPTIITRYDAHGQSIGLCGYVIIAESHITIDTYVAELIIRASIFSCKDFNAEVVKRRLAAAYRLTKVGWQILPRTAGRYEESPVADT